MEPFLIVLDIDGTLLRSDKTVGAYTKETLEKVRKNGHLVMFATGRPFCSSQTLYAELGLNTPIVNLNGAFVHHPLEPSWGVVHQPIGKSIVRHLLEVSSDEYFRNIVIEGLEKTYIRTEDPDLIEKLYPNGRPKIVYGAIHHALYDNPIALLIQTGEEHTESIMEDLEKAHADAIEQRSWGEPLNIIEVVKKGVNKAIGIQEVARRLGIPRERIIAFGDEENDIEMLAYAGCGVAMANAIPALKEVSDEVTSSNDEEGVAQFLESYLLTRREM